MNKENDEKISKGLLGTGTQMESVTKPYPRLVRNEKMPLRKEAFLMAYIKGEARSQHALFPTTL